MYWQVGGGGGYKPYKRQTLKFGNFTDRKALYSVVSTNFPQLVEVKS